MHILWVISHLRQLILSISILAVIDFAVFWSGANHFLPPHLNFMCHPSHVTATQEFNFGSCFKLKLFLFSLYYFVPEDLFREDSERMSEVKIPFTVCSGRFKELCLVHIIVNTQVEEWSCEWQNLKFSLVDWYCSHYLTLLLMLLWYFFLFTVSTWRLSNLN